MKTLNPGDHLRVKHTPLLRKYGIHCSSPERHDNRLLPGDIGTVEVHDGNGWQGMLLVFSRERTLPVATKYPDTDWEFDHDRLKDFVKVK